VTIDEPRALRSVGVVLFDRFELLDVFGPLDGYRATSNRRVFPWAGPGVPADVESALGDVEPAQDFHCPFSIHAAHPDANR
jgi:hypothetical protein